MPSAPWSASSRCNASIDQRPAAIRFAAGCYVMPLANAAADVQPPAINAAPDRIQCHTQNKRLPAAPFQTARHPIAGRRKATFQTSFSKPLCTAVSARTRPQQHIAPATCSPHCGHTKSPRQQSKQASGMTSLLSSTQKTRSASLRYKARFSYSQTRLCFHFPVLKRQ